MQTLRPLTALAVAALLAVPDARAADADTDAAACLRQHDPRTRLSCYDEAMGYMPVVPRPAASPALTVAPRTRYGRFLDSLFAGQAAGGGARLTVIDPATGRALARAEAGSDAFADLLASDPAENDVYLTVLGRETGVEAGAARLVLACEQDITQMIVLWTGTLRAGAAPARLRTDDGTGETLRTTMRVIDNGHASRAPRGIEAIDLLKALRGHDRLQISVDQDTHATRSALFDIADLARNLRLHARRCGWP